MIVPQQSSPSGMRLTIGSAQEKTKTKDYFIGTEDIGVVLGIANKPVVFIGGIDLSNIDIVLSKGAKNIALIRAITQAEDIAKAANDLKARILDFKEKP